MLFRGWDGDVPLQWLPLSGSLIFTSISFSLSFSTPTSQSGPLLRLSAFPILLPGTCFNPKLNLDRYRAYFTCLQFNFCTFMKYSRFLWSVYISNLVVVPSRKYLYASRHLITATFLYHVSCSFFLHYLEILKWKQLASTTHQSISLIILLQ